MTRALSYTGPSPGFPGRKERERERDRRAALEICSLSRARTRLKAAVDSMVIGVPDSTATMQSPAREGLEGLAPCLAHT